MTRLAELIGKGKTILAEVVNGYNIDGLVQVESVYYDKDEEYEDSEGNTHYGHWMITFDSLEGIYNEFDIKNFFIADKIKVK